MIVLIDLLENLKRLHTYEEVLLAALAGKNVFVLAPTNREAAMCCRDIMAVIDGAYKQRRPSMFERARIDEIHCSRTGGRIVFRGVDYDTRIRKIPDWFRGIDWYGGMW